MRLNSLVLYTTVLPEMVAFYCHHFGYRVLHDPSDRITELCPPGDGVVLMLHPAAKGQRPGQVLVKLVVSVPDAEAARASLLAQGVAVGPVHTADGYGFANLKDPAQNSVSLSSRAFRKVL